MRRWTGRAPLLILICSLFITGALCAIFAARGAPLIVVIMVAVIGVDSAALGTYLASRTLRKLGLVATAKPHDEASWDSEGGRVRRWVRRTPLLMLLNQLLIIATLSWFFVATGASLVVVVAVAVALAGAAALAAYLSSKSLRKLPP